MPRYLRTFDEIKKGVALQFQGLNCIQIAKALTEQHLTKLFNNGHITKQLLTIFIGISDNRQSYPRDENIKDLLAKMKEHLPESTKLQDSMLRGTIVHPKRIRSLKKTKQWKEFQEIFTKEYTELEAKKAATEVFEQKYKT